MVESGEPVGAPLNMRLKFRSSAIRMTQYKRFASAELQGDADGWQRGGQPEDARRNRGRFRSAIKGWPAIKEDIVAALCPIFTHL